MKKERYFLYIKMTTVLNKVADYFKFNAKNTNWRKEIIGGLVIFASMSYILLVQPDMIASTTGLDVGALFVITALTSGIFTIMGGFLTNTPTSFAPGMGLNAFFAFTMVGSGNLTYEEGFAVILISGIIFFLITVTGLREKVTDSLPKQLVKTMGIAVGLFIMFIGLQGSGLITNDDATLVAIGDFTNPATIVGLITVVSAVVFWAMKWKLAAVWSMVVGVVLGLIFAYTPWGEGNMLLPTLPTAWNMPDWGEVGHIAGSAFRGMSSKAMWTNPMFYTSIFILFIVDFFDSTGSIAAIYQQAGEVDKAGKPAGMGRAMLVDSIGTIGGSMMGSTTITTYVESLSGVSVGARTGMSAIITGSMFLLSILFLPVVPMITAPVTAGALVIIGLHSFPGIKDLELRDPSVLASSLFMILFTVLSYSISEGIMIGFIVWLAVMLATKRWKEIPYLMYVIVPVMITFLVVNSFM